ncbi:substrate-binding periplasmic protein [Colwelliaceae bacterium 6471]
MFKLKYGVLALCLCSFISTAKTCEQTIRVGLGSIWPPYYYEIDGQPKGIEIEIMELVFKQANFCVQYKKIVTMARNLVELQQGNIDAVFAASFNQEREKYGIYSIPYRTERVRIFWPEPQDNLLNRADLHQLISAGLVGAINVGSYFGPQYDEYLNGKSRNEIVKIPTISRKVKMLQHHRVDFILEDEITGLYYLKENNIEGIVLHPYVVYQNEVAFLFSQKTFSTDQLSIINRAIRENLPQINAILARFQG